MLISKPVQVQEDDKLNELQKAMLQYLPLEQVKKFAQYPELVEKELLNESREPEMCNILRDLFDALHTRNVVKLLKVLQGDKTKLFYAFKKQLESKDRLTKAEAVVLKLVSENEMSLLSLSLMKL